jgi:hypothetical protein
LELTALFHRRETPPPLGHHLKSAALLLLSRKFAQNVNVCKVVAFAGS